MLAACVSLMAAASESQATAQMEQHQPPDSLIGWRTKQRQSIVQNHQFLAFPLVGSLTGVVRWVIITFPLGVGGFQLCHSRISRRPVTNGGGGFNFSTFERHQKKSPPNGPERHFTDYFHQTQACFCTVTAGGSESSLNRDSLNIPHCTVGLYASEITHR